MIHSYEFHRVANTFIATESRTAVGWGIVAGVGGSGGGRNGEFVSKGWIIFGKMKKF